MRGKKLINWDNLTKSRIQKPFWMLAGVVFMMAVWSLLSLAVNSHQLMPSPTKTFIGLVSLYSDKHFALAIFYTVLRGVGGAIISLLLSIFLSIAAGFNERFRLFLSPAMITLRSTPVISFILLAIVWFSPNQVPVFIAILTMLPIIYGNVTEGFWQIDQNLKNMSGVFKVSFYTQLRHLYWPSVMPYFYSGLSTAMGFGWRAIIVGEVLAHPIYGIGTSLKEAQLFLEVDKIIAWTIVGILISALFDKMIISIKNYSLRWQLA